MKAIIRFESPGLLDIYGETDIRGWKIRHRSLEASDYFVVFEQNLEQERAEIKKTDIATLISLGNDAFEELWNEIRKAIVISQSSSVKCYELTKKALKMIYSSYDQLFSFNKPKEDYFEIFDRFVKNVEDILRKYLALSCLLILGPFHVRRKYYPNDISRYILKTGSSSTNTYEGYNEFENLNRGQYRLLFTQLGKDSELFKHIISPLIKGWDKRDLDVFFNFSEISTSLLHIQRYPFWKKIRKTYRHSLD